MGSPSGKHVSPVSLYNGMIGWIDVWRAKGAVYFNFSKAFNTLSHNILTGKPIKCGLDAWTVRWTENCTNARAQRALISGTVYLEAYN